LRSAYDLAVMSAQDPTGLLTAGRGPSPIYSMARLWLNLADSFSRHARYGGPPKSLLLAPERLLLALARDGWLVRNKVIWAKPTRCRPRSVTGSA
jgi:hypothetical protein